MIGAPRSQVVLRIDPDIIREARSQAQARGLSTSELLRKAFNCYRVCASENLHEGHSLAIVDTTKRNRVVRFVKLAN